MSDAATLTHDLGFEELLEPGEGAELGLIEKIRSGLSIEILDLFVGADILSKEDIERTIGASRTIARRRADKQKLNPSESDRLLRIVRIVILAVSVFGSTEKAHRWFYTPNNALEGREPFQLLDTDLGIKMVEKVLNRIEYGVFS